jgi:hypothetical protein
MQMAINALISCAYKLMRSAARNFRVGSSTLGRPLNGRIACNLAHENHHKTLHMLKKRSWFYGLLVLQKPGVLLVIKSYVKWQKKFKNNKSGRSMLTEWNLCRILLWANNGPGSLLTSTQSSKQFS